MSTIVFNDEKSMPKYLSTFNLGSVALVFLNPKLHLFFLLPLSLFLIFDFITSPCFHSSYTSVKCFHPILHQLIFWSGLFILGICILISSGLVFFNWLHQKEKPRWIPREEELALVTGGSSGIGWALTQELKKKGYQVIILDIQKPPNDQYAQFPEEISTRKNEKVWFLQSDICKYDSLKQSIIEIQEKLGKITILVNNAGIVNAKDFLSLTPEQIEKTFQVNTFAHFWTTQLILPQMIEMRYGHIITVASTMGLTSVANMTDYCASKFAVVGFHEALRQEIHKIKEPNLIRTTMICPGLILTGMFSGIRIKFPFLNPPLTPAEVVGALMTSIEATFPQFPSLQNIKNEVSQSAKALISQPTLLQIPKQLKPEDLTTFSLWDKLRWTKRHQVIWIPLTFYLPVFLQILFPPVWTDWVKQILGGNDAITHTFKGRDSK